MTALEAKTLAEKNRDILIDEEFNKVINLITEACNKGHLGVTVKLNKTVDFYVIKKLTELGYTTQKSKNVDTLFGDVNTFLGILWG